MSLFGEPEFEQVLEINQSLGLETVVPYVPPGPVYDPGVPFTGVGLGAGAGVVGPPPAPPPQPPPILPAIPAAAGALGLTMPAWLTAILGVGAAGYGVYQALGGGEGEGLFGNDLLGGGGQQMVDGIPLGGPGLAEPSAKSVLKEWHVSYNWGRLQYYLVQMPTGGRRIALYNTRTKRWKSWPWRKPLLAVIGKNMPSHKQLTRLKRCMVRHRADAKTIMKLTGGTPGQNHHGPHRTRKHRHH